MKARVAGVYDIEAAEPVCLIELEVVGYPDSFDIGAITQADPNLPRMNWQVAYDEQWLERNEFQGRVVFFFHFLDQSRLLETSFGPLELPARTKLPEYLEHIHYEKPC